MHKYCITGDVQKAFLQIKIHPNHRDVQRLLWYTDLERRDICEFCFTRVIFGSASSLYILGATLNNHLTQYKENYPTTVEHLLQNTYVDDMQCLADCVQEVLRFKNESIAIMAEGGFVLHKWHSNVQEVEQQGILSPNNAEVTYAKTTMGPRDQETRLLGIPWTKNSDTFEITF